MARRNTEILAVRNVRRQLAARGDIRGEVALQNDINSLLARLDRVDAPPWVAMPFLASPPPAGEATEPESHRRPGRAARR